MKRLLEAAHFELWRFCARSKMWGENADIWTSLAFSLLVVVQVTYVVAIAEVAYLISGNLPSVLGEYGWIWAWAALLLILNILISPKMLLPVEPNIYEGRVRKESAAFRAWIKVFVITGPATWFLLTLFLSNGVAR